MKNPTTCTLKFISVTMLSWFGACLWGCSETPQAIEPIERLTPQGQLCAGEIGQVYGSVAFVRRQGIPGVTKDVVITTDEQLATNTPIDDRNLLIFVEGSGDQPVHFRHTARLLAESHYHPANDHPNLLILLIHWSASTNVVHEHLNYKAQTQAAATLRRMCMIHQRRHEADGGYIGIIGFSAGTRITQLAFGVELPEGRQGDKPPHLTEVPDEMKHVNHVVYLGSSVNRDDPLPFDQLRGRFINFVNYRDTHYGDRAPYFAPAGTSPVLFRVIEANLFLSRPRTGASANGFSRLPTLTAGEQFELIDTNSRFQQAFRMVNVEVPPELIPWSSASLPTLDDDLDDHWNRAPNHYTMTGRGPKGVLKSPTFDQYKDLTYEFVKEQVASAVMHGVVHEFHLKSKPKPSILPTLLTPLELLLPSAPVKVVKPPESRPATP